MKRRVSIVATFRYSRAALASDLTISAFYSAAVAHFVYDPINQNIPIALFALLLGYALSFAYLLSMRGVTYGRAVNETQSANTKALKRELERLEGELEQAQKQLAQQPIRVAATGKAFRAALREKEQETNTPQHNIREIPPIVKKNLEKLAFAFIDRGNSDSFSFRLLKDAGYSRAESKHVIQWAISNQFAEYRDSPSGSRAFITAVGSAWLRELVTVEGELVS